MNRKDIAKKYCDIYFTPSHIKYEQTEEKFVPVHDGELFKKICAKTNNSFEYFFRGWQSAMLNNINMPRPIKPSNIDVKKWIIEDIENMNSKQILKVYKFVRNTIVDDFIKTKR